MRVFALLDRWARSKIANSEQGQQKPSPPDDDHSSMADFVRLLTEIDLAEASRARR